MIEKLTENTRAPLFELEDVYGRMINLENYRGKRTLIGFYRHAGCPFCNLRVHSLTRSHETLRDRLEMIFFFESKKDIILRSTFHQEVSPIPIISDPEKEMYQAYGIESSGMKSAISHMTSFVTTAIKAGQTGVPMHLMAGDESIKTMPAEFLLDENLMIKKLHYSKRLNRRMQVDDIIDFSHGVVREEVV